MTIRQSLIRAATSFTAGHRERAEAVGRFYLERQNGDGGFRGKGPQSDLYYTGFAVLGLEALGKAYDRGRVLAFLRSFGDGGGLDLAHLAVLARISRLLDKDFLRSRQRVHFLNRLAEFRNPDGGFHHLPREGQSSAYGCFLAMGILEDLSAPAERPQELLAFLEGLRAGNGGYFNERSVPAVSVPATAAAVVTRVGLGRTDNEAAMEWLLSTRDRDGGFRVLPMAPVADLLSTATALFALWMGGADLSAIRHACREFADSLWDDSIGGFHPNGFDEWSDCEYTFYGIMAMGVLDHA
jgi:prenyltransferase beta subunit